MGVAVVILVFNVNVVYFNVEIKQVLVYFNVEIRIRDVLPALVFHRYPASALRPNRGEPGHW